MEVSVADMSDECGFEVRCRDIRPGFDDAVGEAGDRDAGVSRPAAAAGSHRKCRVIRIVARLPQRRSCLRGERARERESAILRRDLSDGLGLLADVALAKTVELEEQRREHRVGQLREVVHRVHLHVVEKLDPRDRNPELDRGDDGADGVLNVLEVTCRCRQCLRTSVQPQRQLGDDPERAFRSDEQLGQVVAGR